jgi:hypothetical protein
MAFGQKTTAIDPIEPGVSWKLYFTAIGFVQKFEIGV